jgi:hypothetical protein
VSIARMGWIEGQPGRYHLYRIAIVVYVFRDARGPFLVVGAVWDVSIMKVCGRNGGNIVTEKKDE